MCCSGKTWWPDLHGHTFVPSTTCYAAVRCCVSINGKRTISMMAFNFKSVHCVTTAGCEVYMSANFRKMSARNDCLRVSIIWPLRDRVRGWSADGSTEVAGGWQTTFGIRHIYVYIHGWSLTVCCYTLVAFGWWNAKNRPTDMYEVTLCPPRLYSERVRRQPLWLKHWLRAVRFLSFQLPDPIYIYLVARKLQFCLSFSKNCTEILRSSVPYRRII